LRERKPSGIAWEERPINRTPFCHSERSEESSRRYDALQCCGYPLGFFAVLRMTNRCSLARSLGFKCEIRKVKIEGSLILRS